MDISIINKVIQGIGNVLNTILGYVSRFLNFLFIKNTLPTIISIIIFIIIWKIIIKYDEKEAEK